MTGRVSSYAARNGVERRLALFGASREHGRGIGFAFSSGVRLLLASIALSALVLWALGCGRIGG
jgi:hypothetical protein